MITFPNLWLAGYNSTVAGAAAFHSNLSEGTRDAIAHDIEAAIADSDNLAPVLEEGLLPSQLLPRPFHHADRR